MQIDSAAIGNRQAKMQRGNLLATHKLWMFTFLGDTTGTLLGGGGKGNWTL
jgi:hypothetical protein